MTRKFVVLLTFAVGLFMAANASAQYGRIADIVSTSHNLSSSSTAALRSTGNTQICSFCHTPHQDLASADPTVTVDPDGQAPLWNHYLSSKASYGVYSSPSFDPIKGDIADLGGKQRGERPPVLDRRYKKGNRRQHERTEHQDEETGGSGRNSSGARTDHCPGVFGCRFGSGVGIAFHSTQRRCGAGQRGCRQRVRGPRRDGSPLPVQQRTGAFGLRS